MKTIELSQDQINRLYDELDFAEDEEIDSCEFDKKHKVFFINYTNDNGDYGTYEATIDEKDRLNYIMEGK